MSSTDCAAALEAKARATQTSGSSFIIVWQCLFLVLGLAGYRHCYWSVDTDEGDGVTPWTVREAMMLHAAGEIYREWVRGMVVK